MAAQTSAAQGAPRIQKFIFLTCWQSASEGRCAEIPANQGKNQRQLRLCSTEEARLASLEQQPRRLLRDKTARHIFCQLLRARRAGLFREPPLAASSILKREY
jgi:hypothetical protein